MEDEPILESATMVAMDIFELFQIVDGDIVYDVNKAIESDPGIRRFAGSKGAGTATREGDPFAARAAVERALDRIWLCAGGSPLPAPVKRATSGIG